MNSRLFCAICLEVLLKQFEGTFQMGESEHIGFQAATDFRASIYTRISAPEVPLSQVSFDQFTALSCDAIIDADFDDGTVSCLFGFSLHTMMTFVAQTPGGRVNKVISTTLPSSRGHDTSQVDLNERSQEQDEGCDPLASLVQATPGIDVDRDHDGLVNSSIPLIEVSTNDWRRGREEAHDHSAPGLIPIPTVGVDPDNEIMVGINHCLFLDYVSMFSF